MHFASIILGATLVVVVQCASIPIKCPANLDVNKQNRKCANRSICHVRHPKYPKECIDRLLSEKYHLQLVQPDQTSTKPRDGEEEYNDWDCPKNTNNGAIYQIIDTNNMLRVVVQSIHFNQTIATERCSTPGKKLEKIISTAHFTPQQMQKYKIYSEQINLDYNFLVLSHDGTRVEYARSRDKVPVACTCRVRL